MSSLADIEAALRAAHAAGNEEDARALAKAYLHYKTQQQIANDPISRDARATIEGYPQGSVQKDALDQMKQRPFGVNLGPAAYNAGGATTDALANLGASPTVAAGGGAVVNAGINAIPSIITSGAPVSEAPSLMHGVSKWLMQKAVKPSVDDLVSGNASRAMDTMLKNSINPTVSSMTKTALQAKALNADVESALANTGNLGVSVGKVTQPANELAQKYAMQVNPTADVSAAQNAVDEFLANPLVNGRQSLPVKLAHELKKGTYAALGSKSYGEMGSASTEAQKQLARGLREGVASAVPEVAPILSKQADLMNVMDVVGRRSASAGNNNPMGLAALRMDDPASAVAFLADRSAPFKSLLANALYQFGKPNLLAPAGLAYNQALQAAPLYGDQK